jgi:multiple sugar transport system substrate-binding protein
LNAAEQAHPTAAWTWDDLTAAAQAVTDMPTLFFTTYGLVLNADFSRWLPFLYQAGGRVLNGDATAMAINSETALESLNFYLGLILDGLAIRPAELSSSWNGEAFGKGRTALTVEGNWIVPYLEQEFPTLQFGVAPLPAGPAGRATLLFSDCYAIAANSAQPQHALALALHLLSPETLHTRMDDQAAAPARISLRETWLAGQPIMEPFLSGVEYARPWQLGAGMQPLVDAVNSGMVQVLNGDIPPEEVLRVAEVIGSDILDD